MHMMRARKRTFGQTLYKSGYGSDRDLDGLLRLHSVLIQRGMQDQWRFKSGHIVTGPYETLMGYHNCGSLGVALSGITRTSRFEMGLSSAANEFDCCAFRRCVYFADSLRLMRNFRLGPSITARRSSIQSRILNDRGRGNLSIASIAGLDMSARLACGVLMKAFCSLPR